MNPFFAVGHTSECPIAERAIKCGKKDMFTIKGLRQIRAMEGF